MRPARSNPLSRLRRIAIPAACAALGASVALYARAATNVPSGVAYSGQLKSNGVAVSGTHAFVFDLVDGGGAALGCSDSRPSLAVSGGRFDVGNLFGGCGAFDSLLGSQAGLFVRIAVDGQTLSPDQPLGSVPYALRARVAENAIAPRSEVVVTGGSGYGAAATTIRRFTTLQSSTGTAITYSDSAQNGNRFVINEDGVYAMTYVDKAYQQTWALGISRNATSLTAGPGSLAPTQRLVACNVGVPYPVGQVCTTTALLQAGDVIRVQSEPGLSGVTAAETNFRIVKVSN